MQIIKLNSLIDVTNHLPMQTLLTTNYCMHQLLN